MVRLCWLTVLGCVVAPVVGLALQADAPVRKLVVGTRHVPPFAIKQPDGSWDGISIELWREIAAENRWEYKLRELTLEELLEGTEKGELDAAVAAQPETNNVTMTTAFASRGLLHLIRQTGKDYCG